MHQYMSQYLLIYSRYDIKIEFEAYLEKAVEKPLEAGQIDVLRIRIVKDRQTAVGSEHIDLAIMYHIPDR